MEHTHRIAGWLGGLGHEVTLKLRPDGSASVEYGVHDPSRARDRVEVIDKDGVPLGGATSNVDPIAHVEVKPLPQLKMAHQGISVAQSIGARIFEALAARRARAAR